MSSTFWLIDLTATAESSSGLNTWALGLLSGIEAMALPDRWAIVGTHALPRSLRAAARVVGVETIICTGHRGLVQQISVPRVARRLRVGALLAASTVVPVWRPGIPAVSVLHDFRHRDQPERYGHAQRRYRDFAYRYAVQHAERLAAISASTARAALREDPDCGSRLTVVYPGADHVDRWPRVTRGSHAIAYAQWANKEPEVAIAAWAMAIRQGVAPAMLHLVGVSDGQRERLERYVTSLDASHWVNVHGRLADADYQALFASAAVLLLTSSAEGLGLPILEAMRLGIPIVASDLPSVREAAGEHAWYVAPGDTDGFARAIGNALSAPAARLEAAQQRAARFTWRGCAEALTESLRLAAAK